MINFVQVTISPEDFSMGDKKLFMLRVRVESDRGVEEFSKLFDRPYFASYFDLMMKEASHLIKDRFK